jgi:hypothetical protein
LLDSISGGPQDNKVVVAERIKQLIQLPAPCAFDWLGIWIKKLVNGNIEQGHDFIENL